MDEYDDNAPIALHDRAMENLLFIKETMERSTSFTGIPGKGMVAMGLIALGGGQVARQYPSHEWWLYCWRADGRARSSRSDC